MTGRGPQGARIAQSAAELERLDREISGWVRLRRDRDRLQQYATSLATLERTLLGAVGALRAEVLGISPEGPLGAVHAGCKRLDRQAALVRQVWSWFRANFDQRDDETLAGLLAAADEVVWSCYQEAVESAELRGIRTGGRWPAPLPYLDPSGVVEAVVRGQPPRGLAPGTAHPALQTFLASLPVPVISLPAGCLDAPWWLALIGHEVGHHLQHDLGLVREIGEAVERAAADDPDAAARWRLWSQEVFADACAVASMGTAAVTAILQVELDTEPKLLPRRGRYPPAVVRLALLAEFASQLGLDGTSVLDGLDPAALVAPRVGDPLARIRADARADLTQVSKVAAAVLTAPLGGAGPLARLFRFNPADHRPGGRVTAWAEAMVRGSARPEQTLRAARDQVAGAVLAWRRIVETPTDDRERETALAVLRRGLSALVAASRKPGVRAVTREQGPQDLSRALTAAVRDAVPSDEEPSLLPDPVGG